MGKETDRTVVAKATLSYTISNIILRGVSLFTAPIFTRLLTTGDYGIASNFTSWSNMVFCVTGLGLATAALRGKIEFKDKYREYLSAIQTLGMLAALFFSAIMLCTLDFWSDLMGLDRICIELMLIYLLVYPSVGFAQIDFRFDYRYKENILISVINTIGSVFCSIGLILLWTEQRYFGRIVGTVIPMIAMGIVFAIRIFKQGRCYFKLEYWRYALNISLPIIPHSLAMIVLGQIDRTMILKYCGESDAGVYSFGYSYGILLSVVTNAMNDAIQPLIYEYLELKDESKLNNIVKLTSSLVSVLIIGVIAVGPEALRLLGTSDYYGGRWIIYPVVIGTMFQFFYQNVTCIEIYFKKTKIIAAGSIGAAVINIILNAVFIPQYGFVAAGYTTLVGYLLLLVYHCIGAYSIEHKFYISNKIWCFYSIIPVFFGGLLVCVYDNWLTRYILLVVYLLIMLICKRNDIKKLMMFIKEKRNK